MGSIRIESLNSTANEDFIVSDCPEIILTLGNTNKLYSGLVDTGAQTSILPWSVFEALQVDRSLITKVRHSLNLCGTTGVHSDAIFGSFTTSAYCLLKKQEGAGHPRVFGRSKITFMVTKPEVRLDRIILGIPWQKSVKMYLHMVKKYQDVYL